MKKLGLVVFVLCSQVSIAQIQGKLRTLTCEHATNSYECYYNELGTLFEGKLDTETIRILLESKENADTLKLGISYVVNKKGKAFKQFFRTNFDKLDGVNNKIRTILNENVSFVMPLNDCYKPVITKAKGILLRYTLVQDQEGQNSLQLIPPKSKGELSKEEIIRSITNPIGKGCKKLEGDNKALKKCLSKNISSYVAKKFSKDVIKEVKRKGIKCTNRIYVSFYYNKEGKPEDVAAIASHPLLEKEAIRVVKKLPKVKPGMKNGAPIRVRFMLPIVFRIQ